CNANGYNDAICDLEGIGNIQNLGCGINNHVSWAQGICTDMRDEDSTENFIPNNPVCGTVSGAYTILGNSSCLTGVGIYFSGTQTVDFGHGSANANDWVVGGATAESFSPVNPGVIRTSNSYLRTTIKNNAL